MFSSFLHTKLSYLTSQEIGAMQRHAQSLGHKTVFLTVYIDSVDQSEHIEDLWSLENGDRFAYTKALDGCLFGISLDPSEVLANLWASAGHFSDGINPRKFKAAQPYLDQVLKGA